MKTLLIFVALFSATSIFAQDQETDISLYATLDRIEVENNAKCELERVGVRICTNRASWQKRYFTCESPGGSFNVSLRVKEKATVSRIYRRRGRAHRAASPCFRRSFSDPIVTKVIYYND